LTGRWRSLASSRYAVAATAILLSLQVGGCALDLFGPQLSLWSAFCLVTHNAVLDWADAGLYLLLAFSWIAGLLSLRFVGLRPAYWLLFAAIPVALAGQSFLLAAGILSCDAP
jgi:hypothetical protein